MKNKILIALLCSIPFVSSCVTNNGEHSIKPLEQMTDLEYSKWKLYIQLGVKIGANRLLQEKVVTSQQLTLAASVIENVPSQPILEGAKSLIIPALEKAGFKNDEVTFLLLVAEQELLAHGALNWLNPETNALELSPRTKEVLAIIASSLRTANTTSENEKMQASNMKADFSRQE